MSQRHFIAASIGTRPHIALICLFLFIAGAQNVAAQSQIARKMPTPSLRGAASSATGPTALIEKLS